MGKTADIQETILDIKMELMTVEEVAKVFNVKSHTVKFPKKQHLKSVRP